MYPLTSVQLQFILNHHKTKQLYSGVESRDILTSKEKHVLIMYNTGLQRNAILVEEMNPNIFGGNLVIISSVYKVDWEYVSTFIDEKYRKVTRSCPCCSTKNTAKEIETFKCISCGAEYV